MSLLKTNFNNYFEDNLYINKLLSKDKNIFEKITQCLVYEKKLKKRIERAPVFFDESLRPKIDIDLNEKLFSSQIFDVDRALLSFFGFPAYGVHCNGWQYKNKSYHMVLAKRSAKILNFPGCFDNLIGGGQPSTLSLRKNLEKEALEEAGLSKETMDNATFCSCSRYFLLNENNFNPSVLFTFDLEINDLFSPKNIDGEVEEFQKFEISEIFELLDQKKLKPNSIIPIVNFIIKRIDNFFNKSTINEIKKYL